MINYEKLSSRSQWRKNKDRVLPAALQLQIAAATAVAAVAAAASATTNVCDWRPGEVQEREGRKKKATKKREKIDFFPSFEIESRWS